MVAQRHSPSGPHAQRCAANARTVTFPPRPHPDGRPSPARQLPSFIAAVAVTLPLLSAAKNNNLPTSALLYHTSRCRSLRPHQQSSTLPTTMTTTISSLFDALLSIASDLRRFSLLTATSQSSEHNDYVPAEVTVSDCAILAQCLRSAWPLFGIVALATIDANCGLLALWQRRQRQRLTDLRASLQHVELELAQRRLEADDIRRQLDAKSSVEEDERISVLRLQSQALAEQHRHLADRVRLALETPTSSTTNNASAVARPTPAKRRGGAGATPYRQRRPPLNTSGGATSELGDTARSTPVTSRREEVKSSKAH